MVAIATREMILPALRLDVPDRPAPDHLVALAERSPDAWTTSPSDWVTQQVVRLAVAEVLQARLASVDPERLRTAQLSADPEELTLGKLAGLFRPHIDLTAQAFQAAVVQHLGDGLGALTEPVREGLRRGGVTGRDRIHAIALGLDKVPSRARQEFWKSLHGSAAVSGVVDALASSGAGQGAGAHDVTTLDRSHLARAEVVVQAGGRVVAMSVGNPPRDDAGSWLRPALAINRQPTNPLRPGAIEVVVKPTGWTEVFDTALSAVSVAMREIDLGSRARGGRGDLTSTIATRLTAARERTVADVVASLRAIDPFVAEVYGPHVSTTAVRVPVPVIEDERLMELWLPTSALAGPLFTGAVDLFFGPDAEVRSFTRGRDGQGNAGKGGGRSGKGSGRRGQGGAGQGAGQGKPGGKRQRGPRRPQAAPATPQPAAPEAPAPEASATEVPAAPAPEAPATEASAES